MKRHMKISIRHCLVARDFSGFVNDDGSTPSVADVVNQLCDHLAQGHEYLPVGDCDNWDWKTGCKGHPSAGEQPAEAVKRAPAAFQFEERPGQNPAAFKKGDRVMANVRGGVTVFEVVEPDKRGMAKLKNLRTGEVEDWNAHNNRIFMPCSYNAGGTPNG